MFLPFNSLFIQFLPFPRFLSHFPHNSLFSYLNSLIFPHNLLFSYLKSRVFPHFYPISPIIPNFPFQNSPFPLVFIPFSPLVPRFPFQNPPLPLFSPFSDPRFPVFTIFVPFFPNQGAESWLRRGSGTWIASRGRWVRGHCGDFATNSGEFRGILTNFPVFSPHQVAAASKKHWGSQ